jgi:hypothetical protein
VRHHAREFAFIMCDVNQTAIDIHVTARQSEGVNVAHVYDLELIAKFRVLKFLRNGCHKTFTDAAQVIRRRRVTQDRHLSFDFRCRLLTGLNIVIR